jgi:hypothetical protein
MDRNVILAHRDLEEREIEAAQCYFDVERLRTKCCYDKIVIPRGYGAIDWKELEDDLYNLGSRSINSYRQRQYIATFEYYRDVTPFTPKTWFSLRAVIESGYSGPFVLKGVTNSAKHIWDEKMYAASLENLYKVDSALRRDGFIGYQDIVYRKYIPLNYLGHGLNGLPYSEEYRLFFYKDNYLAGGFYWSTAQDEIVDNYRLVPIEAVKFTRYFSDVVSEHINFWVADVARTTEGNWILIELNDGCSSGLSEVNPNALYRNLQFRIFNE